MKWLTHKNHFKFGYNSNWYNLRQSSEDIWHVKYGRCERDPSDFRSECVNAARLIREATTLPIYICFSGGMDSEIVVRSFMEANIPITCLIASFDDLNQHDISYAFEFCSRHSLPYEVHRINIPRFWKEDLMEYAIKTNCISPQLPVIMWLADKVKGHVVLGSGECYMVRNEKSIWELWEKEKIASWYRHFMVSDKEGTPGFFQYTPELMLSFITDDVINMDLNIGSSTYYEKKKVYNKYWNDLIERPIHTGFEAFKELDYNLFRPYLERKFQGSNGVHKTSIADLLETMSPIHCKKVSVDEVMKYHHLYEAEGMTLKRCPYDSIIETKQAYAAYINGELAGFTFMDLFKGNTGCYAHGAYTFSKFRGQGINRTLWNFKMKDLVKYPDIILHAINPSWLPDAQFQKEMLERKGFKQTSVRPDGAPVLTVKFKELL